MTQNDIDTESSPAPIFRLPDELIVEIVITAYRPPPATSPWNTREAEDPQWTMSHVCRRLRHAVINASVLWRWAMADLSRVGSVERFKLYIERSAPCKIRVSLSAGPSDIEAQSLRALDTDCVARVAALYILFESRQALDTILHPFRNVAAPSLSILDIRSSEPCKGTDDPVVDLSALNAARLFGLVLDSCICGPDIPDSMRSSLVHLRFLHSAALHDLDLWAFLFEDSSSQPLRSLTSLYLDWCGAIRFSHPLNRDIVSHSLTHLSLELYGRTEEAIRHFPRLPSLKWLAFVNTRLKCRISNHNHVPITRPLHALAKLTTLILIKQCFTARILSDLLGPNSEPCPYLDILAVWPLDSDVDQVYEVLQEVVRCKRSCSPVERIPVLGLSPDLYARAFWEENTVEVGLLKDVAEFVDITHHKFSFAK
ncbi:hypothetical protein FB45DRAFT_920929 [Roridomyces roridus]|uniref:F-box domain-containing protein n=1 Tax=Roridomyces roridus TaxID=1738132 RepID=A0AAD7FM21_9AGAR|nr:hypothetical protein FB45DRAFT_920929 [Roridomyces roridus]